MSPNLVALLYLAAGVLFIMALRGLSSPESSRRGNQYGMIGMAIAVLTTLAPAQRRRLAAHLGADRRRPGDRRRHRRHHRAPHPHDVDAGAGGGVPLARRPGGGVRGGRRALCAGSLRHRPPRQHRGGQPAGDVARRRHRRHHLHRLGDRLRQAVGPHVRQADHAARPPSHQHRPRRADGAADLLVLPVGRRSHAVLGHHGRARCCSACSSSSRSAAPTCRS